MDRQKRPYLQIEVVETEPIHFHEELELLFLLEGRVSIEAGCDKWQIEKEDILMINSGIRHSLHALREGSIICKLMIPHQFIGSYINNSFYLIWCNSVSDKADDYGKIRKMLKELARHCLIKKDFDFYYQGKIYQLLSCLIEEYLITNEDIRYHDRISKEDERISQILSYIQENYNKEISLKDLAKKLYLTDAYLSRFIKKVLGRNFWEYLNSVKLHYVVEDLLYSTKSITRIAMDNGFANMATFNKSFRNMYHMTPSEYKASSGPKKQKEWKIKQEKEKRLLQELEDFLNEPAELAGQEGIEKYNVEIDANQKREYPRPWKKLLNAGSLEMLRDHRIRSDLLRVNSALKITHVRFWNVLCDSTGLGMYKSDNLQDYDWGILNECLDFLLQNHMKPVFHMGYKKGRSGEGGYTYVDQNFSFQSLWEIEKVFELLLRHMIMRYGREEVDTWCFELWYPNIYYSLPKFLEIDRAFAYTAEIYKTIRRMLPEVNIGLAEFSLLTDSNRLYERMAAFEKRGIIPNFVSCVSYPYKVVQKGNVVVREWQFKDEFILEEIKNLKHIMNQVGWGHLPIWMTEYNFTLLNGNPLNDSRFKGAWILKSMADVAEHVEVVGHWQLSDLCALPADADHNRLLYGGKGLITKDGINKPSYFALYFLSLLKPFLVDKGKHYMLTVDKQGAYAMVVFNMKLLGAAAYMKPEEEITTYDMEHIFENEKPVQMQLHLNGIKPGKYRIKSLIIDSKHGGIQDWLNKNKQIEVLKGNEIWHLQQMCMPDMQIYIKSVDQILDIDITLGANDFMFYEIERVN